MAAPKANERREPVFDGASAPDSGAEAPTPRRSKPADGGNRPKRKRRSRKREACRALQGTNHPIPPEGGAGEAGTGPGGCSCPERAEPRKRG